MVTKNNKNVKYLAMIVTVSNNYYYCYRSFTQFQNKLKRVSFFLTLLLLLFLTQITFAQTTKTVGSGGNYTTLKLAFDAINAGTITGAITLQIIGNTTETTAAVLYASGTGSSSYSSVNIYPTTSGLSISGNYNSHMIDLSGADNVTFDGRVNATGSTKDLTITNISTGTSATTIRFINSAENNTVKYCNVTGSEVNQTRGIIFFSTSSEGNGNDNNLIDNNNITSNAGNRVLNAIYALGTTGRDNTGNTISNNNIYDVWRTSASSFAIQVSSYNSNWTITGNSIYETSTFVPTGAYTYCAIKLNYSSGVGFVVTDNYIGGQSPQCGGSALTVNAATAHLFQGIMLFLGTSTATSVQNNTIKNINYMASSTSLWQGIYIAGGSVNVGTVTGNKIGASTGTGSIVVTSNVNPSVVQGINFSGNGAVNIQNNTIGSITVNNSNSAYASNFYAINRTNTGTTIIANNLIGSTETSNSINVTSASTESNQSVFGIRNTTGGSCTYNSNTIANMSNATTNTTSGTLGLINGILSNYGITTITNNNIYNLTIANNNTASSSAASVTGIAVASTNALNTISGNTVYNLSNTYASFTGTVIGIYFGSTGMYTTISHTVTENFIHDLSITGALASSASIYGIKVNTGQTTYANNIISLGGNTANTIYGIYEYGTSANNNSLYFNTVYIGGSLSAGVTNKSYALYSAVSSNVRNFRNNIFVNARSTTSGSNLHYAAYFNYSLTSSITINYNDYYVSGTGGVLGYHNGSNKTSLPLITGQDANSLTLNPNFNSAGGTLPENYYSSATLPGITGTIITADYAGVTRGSTPKMGAYETEAYIYTWQGNTSSNYGTASNWVGGLVPPDGVDISFAPAPANHCLLDQNRIVRSITNNNATYKLNLNGYQLTIHGSITQTNGAQIDASNSSSVVVFHSSTLQNIPSGTFVNNTVGGLEINSNIGVTSNNDLTVQQGLTLTSGAFNIGAYTLTVNGAVTTTSGTLTGGSSTNLTLGGSGAATLPSVTLNNFTLNRSNGVTLNGDLSISGLLTLTTGTLVVGGNSLVISGTLSKTSGNIDASNSNATVNFNNSSALTLPSSLFTGALNNVAINGAGGITASNDLTVNGILSLQSANPSSTKGLLDMGSNTLNMGVNSTTVGIGDVIGIVRREHTFTTNSVYTFGSEYTTFTFVDNDTKPTWIICKISIGNIPGWSGWTTNGKIKRYYNVAASNNSSTSKAAINMRYLISELDATYNEESKLVFWHKYVNFHGGDPHEHGKSNQDFLNHTLGVTGIIFGMAATTNPDESEVGIAYSTNTKNVWKGEVTGHQTEWGQTQNWTAGRVPLSSDDVLIPSGLAYYPSLTEDVVAQSIEILSGASLTANTYNITISGAEGAWINSGTFNAGTGKVIFNHGVPAEIVTVSGTTNFYNIECGENTTMQPVAGCMLRIEGNGTAFASSVVDFSTINNTVEYNGVNQTIVNPNGMNGNSGYYNLRFSGSGTKTMPVTAMNITGNLIISGNANVTAASSLTIGGNLNIVDTSTFNTGNYNHTLRGSFENNATFVSVTGYSLTMTSSTEKYISGDSLVNFKNLYINNDERVLVFANLSISNTLTLTKGYLCLGGAKNLPESKLISGKTNNKTPKSQAGDGFSDQTLIVISGDITFGQNTKIDATTSTSTIEFAGTSAQTIPDGAFLDNTVSNIKINNANGVTLYTDLLINGTLTLSNGLFNTGNKSITFGSLATDPVEKSTSRIVGTATVQNIETGISSFSFLSCYIAAGSDDIGHVTVTRKTGALGVINVNGNNSIQSNWEINSDYPPSNGRTVEYKWLSDLDNGKTFSAVNKAINYFSTDNGTTWTLFGNPVDVSPSNPRVMTFSTTHFSQWVASDQNSPLPVTLASLNSAVNGRNVKLNWSTNSEINNKGFEIERKSENENWIKVGYVNGKGNINTITKYTFEDKFLNTGKYSYRLKQIDFNGNFEYHNLSGLVEIGVPTKYDLSQNYPNPFNPVTKINYELPYDSKVSIIIYDITGREIKTLINEIKTAGYYTQTFSATGISSGTYFYRIIANSNGKEYIAAKKMTLVK